MRALPLLPAAAITAAAATAGRELLRAACCCLRQRGRKIACCDSFPEALEGCNGPGFPRIVHHLNMHDANMHNMPSTYLRGCVLPAKAGSPMHVM